MMKRLMNPIAALFLILMGSSCNLQVPSPHQVKRIEGHYRDFTRQESWVITNNAQISDILAYMGEERRHWQASLVTHPSWQWTFRLYGPTNEIMRFFVGRDYMSDGERLHSLDQEQIADLWELVHGHSNQTTVSNQPSERTR